MELKRKFPKASNHKSIVLIEPLWNWNSLPAVWTKSNVCINWTFMELKRISIIYLCNRWSSINWTFMELKLRIKNLIARDYLSINWTFMELKQANSIFEKKIFNVLIEPLWNWNLSLSALEMVKVIVLIEPLWNWNNIPLISVTLLVSY